MDSHLIHSLINCSQISRKLGPLFLRQASSYCFLFISSGQSLKEFSNSAWESRSSSNFTLWSKGKKKNNFVLKNFLCYFFSLRVHETWMNSFLFNVLMVLICSVAVTQFCANSFAEYARLTEISMIFGTQIRYLRFFKYFFDNNVFEIALLV